MNKSIYYVIQVALFLAIGLILYAIYLLVYPYHPLVIRTQPVKVETKIVKAGQDIIYDVDYCKTGNDAMTVSRTIQGTSYIPTPIVQTITYPGCAVAVIHLATPEGATPGVYHINISAETNPNPFRTFKIGFITEDFQIIK